MKFWVRVGTTIDITAEEADVILGDPCCEKMSEIIHTAFREGRFYLDGNIYAPEESVKDFNELYGTDYEVFEPECEL